ncbi:Brp/Blh family beta-carotene 15,15'-dioxygenase [Flavobacterium sp.]|uniref:Brp/Blh family beta-carotene 15,15'-dioxygenase n=1 Tax=Flavobacterium sp. TaxID=239 RepID=UPI003753665B
MTRSNKFAIVVSFFALWINVYFSFKYQQLAGFVVIFLFGILHGANDLALYTKIDHENSNKSFKKILIYYLLVIFFGFILFYCIPTLALLLFLLFSGYHFGEQHWNNLKDSKNRCSSIIFQTTYGLFIFSLLFYFHEEEVKLIVSKIINFSIGSINFAWITLASGIALVLSSISMARASLTFKNQIVINIFYIFVFAIIFKTADLIWAFAIYFVVWHSLPSINEQINYLYGDFTLRNFQKYFKSAFIYWIVSLNGILILFLVFKDKQLFTALFFSFLAAITFPHTIIIIKMQNKK